MKWLPLVGYVATIPAANWAITTFGLVPVGFGLLAPAGVYFAGLAFTLRDLTQETLGRAWTLGAIGAGALLSLAVSDPFVAAASASAFLVSELVDWIVYQPLRERRWLWAVAASNAVGLVVDSVLFCWMIGFLTFVPGQIIAKSYMTLMAIAILWTCRRCRREQVRYAM